MFCEDSRNDAQSHQVFGLTPNEYRSYTQFAPEIDSPEYLCKAAYFVANYAALSGSSTYPSSHCT